MVRLKALVLQTTELRWREIRTRNKLRIHRSTDRLLSLGISDITRILLTGLNIEIFVPESTFSIIFLMFFYPTVNKQ